MEGMRQKPSFGLSWPLELRNLLARPAAVRRTSAYGGKREASD
jgi:hypothetical protein